ncbi:DUF402 domain-containing protein [Micromonospora coerulea]|uniref:DUF402 domain-containing protein n=1 Tax=Micromonospora coerulea TaxID=47856 RepID=UPI0019055C41|nr:DUF402 domain-containing protein [Micromonospora veneta]
MVFESGQVITRRYLRGGRCTWAQPMRVLADDEQGLLLWHPAGSEFARLVDADGRTQHELTVDRMRDPKLTVLTWQDYDLLVLMPPKAAHSVWWFFQAGSFAGWYVNLEEPYVRRPDGVDSDDLVLDIVVTPQRQWEWKDADEFDGRIGHPLYFDQETAAEVRAEGDRLTKLIEAGEFPFDGAYTDFRPDPHWPALRLPADLA